MFNEFREDYIKKDFKFHQAVLIINFILLVSGLLISRYLDSKTLYFTVLIVNLIPLSFVYIVRRGEDDEVQAMTFLLTWCLIIVIAIHTYAAAPLLLFGVLAPLTLYALFYYIKKLIEHY